MVNTICLALRNFYSLSLLRKTIDIHIVSLHRALPDLCNGSIKELADIVFDYRFNMGSIENCSFVYEKMIEQAKELRKLY